MAQYGVQNRVIVYTPGSPHFDALEESQIGILELNMYSNFELCKDQLFADSFLAHDLCIFST